jgi:hypothetical protein
MYVKPSLEFHCSWTRIRVILAKTGNESRLPGDAAATVQVMEGCVGSRVKNNPPRRQGPKPERVILPGPWKGKVGKTLKKKRRPKM